MDINIDYKLFFKTIKYLAKQKCLVEIICTDGLSYVTIVGRFKYKRRTGGYKLFFQTKEEEYPLTKLNCMLGSHEFEITTKMNGSFVSSPKMDLEETNKTISKNQKKYLNKLYPQSTCKAMKILNFYYYRCKVSFRLNDCVLMINNIVNPQNKNLDAQKTTNDEKIKIYKEKINQLQSNMDKLINENEMISLFIK